MRRAIALNGLTLPPARQPDRLEDTVNLRDVIYALYEQGWTLSAKENHSQPWLHALREGDPVVAEYRRRCGASRRITVSWPPSGILRIPIYEKLSASWDDLHTSVTTSILSFRLVEVTREHGTGPYVVVYEEM